MILIATALRAEAKPLIAVLGLSAVAESIPPVYTNNSFALTITGVGRVRAAAAIGYCFGRLPDISAVINVGIAGSTTRDVGDIVLVNALHDDATGRQYFPDMMTSLTIAEGSLTTYDIVQIDGNDLDLVDMEGAGIYEAAARYLPPHRIALLKIVSDMCNGVAPNATQVGELAQRQLPKILEAVRAYASMPPDKVDPIANHAEVINDLVTCLRLTATQRVQLEDALRDRLLNVSSDVPNLHEFLTEPAATKQEGKVRFERLVKTLLDA